MGKEHSGCNGLSTNVKESSNTLIKERKVWKVKLICEEMKKDREVQKTSNSGYVINSTVACHPFYNSSITRVSTE